MSPSRVTPSGSWRTAATPCGCGSTGCGATPSPSARPGAAGSSARPYPRPPARPAGGRLRPRRRGRAGARRARGVRLRRAAGAARHGRHDGSAARRPPPRARRRLRRGGVPLGRGTVPRRPPPGPLHHVLHHRRADAAHPRAAARAPATGARRGAPRRRRAVRRRRRRAAVPAPELRFRVRGPQRRRGDALGKLDGLTVDAAGELLAHVVGEPVERSVVYALWGLTRGAPAALIQLGLSASTHPTAAVRRAALDEGATAVRRRLPAGPAASGPARRGARHRALRCSSSRPCPACPTSPNGCAGGSAAGW